MENYYLSALVDEIRPELEGRSVSKIALINRDLLIDFRLTDERLLLASLDPAGPALYISRRGLKPGDQDSQVSHPFLSLLRKNIVGARLIRISKPPSDRVVRLVFERFDAGGDKISAGLVISLKGRSSNAYLTTSTGRIEASLTDRGLEAGVEAGEHLTSGVAPPLAGSLLGGVDESSTKEQLVEKFFGPKTGFGPSLEREFIHRCLKMKPAEAFQSLVADLFEMKPVPLVYSRAPLKEIGSRPTDPKSDILLSHIELQAASRFERYEFTSLSEAADQYYRARARARAYQNEFSSLKRLLTDEIKKRETLMKAIAGDRDRFGDPDRLKRYGDLLLANLATSKPGPASVRVVDYYDASQPEIEIEINEGATLQQAASDYFSRYQKARRALEAARSREAATSEQISALRDISHVLDRTPSIEQIVDAKDRVNQLLGKKPARQPDQAAGKKSRGKDGKQTGRRFLSTDGFEVVVGRNDRDNDSMTFRLARPHDIWLHAADYPGSHVIIRNPARAAVPHRAIIEAAELAAFFSQAKRDAKVGVHYTEKKFVSKPPRSKPGLVRLSSFKTLYVVPQCRLARI